MKPPHFQHKHDDLEAIAIGIFQNILKILITPLERRNSHADFKFYVLIFALLSVSAELQLARRFAHSTKHAHSPLYGARNITHFVKPSLE
jgi:hypothetical protein